MKLARSFGFLVLSVFLSFPASQAAEPVAAVVNDAVITQHDLEQRTKLALLIAGLPDTPEMRTRVQGSLLRRLIDEDLKIQAATASKIPVTANDITAQMEAIEQQNHLPSGGLLKLLAGRSVEPEALRQQVRADIAWARLVHYVLTKRVHVSDNAVTTRIDAIRANLGKPEYRAAEIFLSLDDVKNEDEVKDLADRLVGQMHQGAPLTAIALQFNQGGSADGSLGWVSEGMMDDELFKALSALKVNEVTAPIRTTEGYYILTVLEKRKVGDGYPNGATVDLMTIDLNSLSSAGPAERDLQMRHLREALAPAKNCDDLQTLGRQVPSASFSIAEKQGEADLPFKAGPLIKDLAPGQISEPIDTQKGRRFFAVCGRGTANSDGLPSAAEIRQQMEDAQLELVTRHYLLDLHGSAVINVREQEIPAGPGK